MLYVWIGVLIVALIAEAITNEFVAIWFFPSALIAMFLSFFATPVWLQSLVFVTVGLVLVFATRPLCNKLLSNKKEKTNVASLVGKTCVVTEEIHNIEETGEVKVGGLCWSARSEDPDRVIAVGEQVTVLEIRGVKLIVK